MSFRYRRRVVRRLDTLIIGANPDKLKAQTEIPAANLREAVPLSAKEIARLRELDDKQLFESPLTYRERLERDRLQARLYANKANWK